MDFYEDEYLFPALAEASLSATQFFEKIFHLGFNAESLFYCSFGEKEHFLGHPNSYDRRKCFCLCLAGHPNKSTADWLIPFAARFVNPSKIKLCSKIRSLMKPESIEKVKVHRTPNSHCSNRSNTGNSPNKTEHLFRRP